jgi:hypothetical protein
MSASEPPASPAAAPAKPSAEATPLVEEARVGTSDRARKANLAVLALSRAARSFLLYDPGNDAIRRFIEDLRTRMTQALAGGDALRFEVRPFELALDGEVVYLERDREHSLAFRMYRDGVRRLTISGAAEWDELLRLLEILSIRYTGVRQYEDDIVTLLWKAGFKHIEIEAVEGFVPEDEEEDAQARRGHASAVTSPDDWDLPLRSLGAAASLAWTEVTEQARQALCNEEASHLLAANATQAATALLERASEGSDAIGVADVLPFVAEVRDFLLAEGQLEQVTTLVRVLQMNATLDPERIGPLMLSFGDRRALMQILHSTPKAMTTPPAELVELLDLLPGERLAHLIDALSSERGEAARRVARQLVERYASDDPEYLVSRLKGAEAGMACDLLRALGGALPDRAVEVATELIQHPDASVVSEAMRRLEAAAPQPRVARALLRLLDSPHDELRLQVLEILGSRYGGTVFEPLARSTERRAATGFPLDEAELIGRTLAHLAPGSAMTVFKGWARPKGLMGRLVESRGHGLLAWVAVAGLGALPDNEAEATIREVAHRADAELRRHCMATLARRRHEGVSRG